MLSNHAWPGGRAARAARVTGAGSSAATAATTAAARARATPDRARDGRRGIYSHMQLRVHAARCETSPRAIASRGPTSEAEGFCFHTIELPRQLLLARARRLAKSYTTE